MTIRDLQQKIADALNGVEELVQHGCKVFAEDMLTTQDALNNAVATAGRIAVVVVTPRFERDASGCADGFPAGCELRVACIEAHPSAGGATASPPWMPPRPSRTRSTRIPSNGVPSTRLRTSGAAS